MYRQDKVLRKWMEKFLCSHLEGNIQIHNAEQTAAQLQQPPELTRQVRFIIEREKRGVVQIERA